MNHGVRNRQQVGSECVELHLTERESQVLLLWNRRYLERKPEDVQGPEVKVFKTLPQELGCDRLAIVHGALARVLADDPIDDDRLFSWSKPAILPSKPTRRLGRARRHK